MPKTKAEPLTIKSVLHTLLVRRAHIDVAGVMSWWEYKRMGYVELDKHGFYRITQKGVDAYYEED